METPEPSRFSQEQTLTPEDGSEITKGKSRASSPTGRQRSIHAGPEYATTSGSQVVAARSPPAATMQAIAVDAKKSRSNLGRHFVGFRVALLWKRKPTDAFKELSVAIQTTGHVIQTQEWAPKLKSSALSIIQIANAEKLSPETRQLLETGAEEFNEFKREEEEKRSREEEELAKIEEEMEVVDTRLVQRGPMLRRVQRLRPVASMTTLGTLDPRATETTSMSPTGGCKYAGASSLSCTADSRATESGPTSRSSISGPVMDRGPGFKRPSRMEERRYKPAPEDPISGSFSTMSSWNAYNHAQIGLSMSNSNSSSSTFAKLLD
ncbi:hypothetical protein SLS60_010732 [Paraconiothyrium brasiliense]|uniref:Uncharacterized protein n=1 Tax=Paraconiothyrium brasiliense TaxID=300254 RepID=A0ABR3QLU4_9PLEO